MAVTKKDLGYAKYLELRVKSADARTEAFRITVTSDDGTVASYMISRFRPTDECPTCEGGCVYAIVSGKDQTIEVEELFSRPKVRFSTRIR